MISATAPGPGGGSLMVGVLTQGATDPMGQRSMGSIPGPLSEANVWPSGTRIPCTINYTIILAFNRSNTRIARIAVAFSKYN